MDMIRDTYEKRNSPNEGNDEPISLSISMLDSYQGQESPTKTNNILTPHPEKYDLMQRKKRSSQNVLISEFDMLNTRNYSPQKQTTALA